MCAPGMRGRDICIVLSAWSVGDTEWDAYRTVLRIKVLKPSSLPSEPTFAYCRLSPLSFNISEAGKSESSYLKMFLLSLYCSCRRCICQHQTDRAINSTYVPSQPEPRAVECCAEHASRTPAELVLERDAFGVLELRRTTSTTPLACSLPGGLTAEKWESSGRCLGWC